jgi:hypothetical protein
MSLSHSYLSKSYFAYRNHCFACPYHNRDYLIHTHTCQNYYRVSENYTLRVKSLSACDNRTLREEINLVRVEITLVRVVYILRVEITLVRVVITLVIVKFTRIRVKIISCV